MDQLIVNKQIGWKVGVQKRPHISDTGQVVYLNTTSDLIDARLSATAVRKVLDEALARAFPDGMASFLATRAG